MDDFFHGHLGIQRLDPRSSPRCLGQLTSDPERRSLVDFGVRYWPVSRFPFVVLYDLYGLRYGSAGHLPADLRLSAPGSKRWNRNSPTITSGR